MDQVVSECPRLAPTAHTLFHPNSSGLRTQKGLGQPFLFVGCGSLDILPPETLEGLRKRAFHNIAQGKQYGVAVKRHPGFANRSTLTLKGEGVAQAIVQPIQGTCYFPFVTQGGAAAPLGPWAML